MTNQSLRVERQIVLASHADRQFAQCPFVGQLDAVDRHGFGMTFGCRGRHDADPDIALDEPANCVEAAQLHPQFEAAANPFGLLGQKALQGAGPVQTDEIAVEHLGKGAVFD